MHKLHALYHLALFVSLFFLSLNTVAGSMGTFQDEETYHPWSIIGSLGYTWYDNAYHDHSIDDGQSALGRFAIARDFGQYKRFRFGMETGVQNGNTMRPNIPQNMLNAIGGLHPQLTIKPILDLLATISWQPMENKPVFGLVKTGIAYRHLQVTDRTTFNDLSQVGFEIQAGAGIRISEHAILSLNYQGIVNNNTSYAINNNQFTGSISNIPSQNGILLSLSYSI